MKFVLRFLIFTLVCIPASGCISNKIAEKYSANKALAAETVGRLESEQACCASYSEIRYQRLEDRKRLALLLDPSTPVFDFPFGKSRFMGFEIPMTTNAVELEITAIEVQSGAKPMFRPRVLLLDGEFRPIQDQPNLSFDKYFFGATNEGHSARVRIQPSLARYVIVAADPDFIGREYTGGGKSYAMPTGGGYVGVAVPKQNFPYGYEGKGFIAIRLAEN